MKIRTLVRLPMYGLAAYGAMTLWERYLSDWYASTYQPSVRSQPRDATLTVEEPSGNWIRVETTAAG